LEDYVEDAASGSFSALFFVFMRFCAVSVQNHCRLPHEKGADAGNFYA